MRTTSNRKRFVALIGMLAVTVGSAASATGEEELSYFRVPLSQLGYERGRAPEAIQWGSANDEVAAVREPFARLVGEGEVYLGWVDRPRALLDLSHRDSELCLGRFCLAAAVPRGRPARGVLYLPNGHFTGYTEHPFRLSLATPGSCERRDFLRTKRDALARKARYGFPGAPWFGRRAALLDEELRGGAHDRLPRDGGRWTSEEIDETFELFSGGRALSENLALDRELDPESTRGALSQEHPLEEIEGIAIDSIDWAPIIAGLDPELDPLASLVPHDQHVVLLPSFPAMIVLFDEAEASGTPILQLLEPCAEDARTMERYRAQLCLPPSALARRLGPALVSSIAFTGSDPYLRTGSDVAVLFECADPALLLSLLSARQRAAAEQFDLAVTEGLTGGLAWTGVKSPDRRICSYLARIGWTVCVTNSTVQLERLAEVQRGELEPLAQLGEYRFFRDRYRRGDDETAFFLLSDATIRRWSSPRWRIGASRRTRAASFLSSYRAAHLGTPADRSRTDTELLEPELAVPGGGAVHLTPRGPESEVFGHLEFLTPIAELPIEGATAAEKSAYDRFREGYESGWATVFDPIGGRVVLEHERLVLDVTVMPLTVGSEYGDLLEYTGDVKLPPFAGDLHPEGLLSFALSIDHDSPSFREMEDSMDIVVPSCGERPLSWMGDHLVVYADRDSFWSEAARAEDEERFRNERFHRLPVAVHFAVADPGGLEEFLAEMRELTSPPIHWKEKRHRGHRYECLTLDLDFDWGDALSRYVLHHVALEDSWVLSLREELIHRAIDRHLDLEGRPAESPRPRPGRSAALHVEGRALEVVRGLAGPHYRDRMRLRSWKNLPILEEWKRLYPDRDPVDVHQELWHVRLLCPGGGEYVWDEAARAMESTVYGRPAAPREGPELPRGLERLESADFELTFERDGVRARAELFRRPR